MAVVWRHGVVGIRDTRPSFGVGERAGFECLDAVFESVSAFGGVEAEAGLAVGFAFGVDAVIGSMAYDALG